MRIALVGQPFWCRRLASSLRRAKRDTHVSYVDLRSPISLQCLIFCDILLSVGYRPGARTNRGRAFDALIAALRGLRPRTKIAFLWIGTDVLNCLKDKPFGYWPFERARNDLHIAAAPWLADELHECGVRAAYVPFPAPLPSVDTPQLPASFEVLTYIPDGRPKFYGGEMLMHAAKALPSIKFNVIGGTGTWCAVRPSNVLFSGWVDDVVPHYVRSTAVMRLVQHDAVGGSVREGLALGRHVLYSYPLPHTHFVKYGDSAALISALSQLFDIHASGRLAPNYEGGAFVRNEFDETRNASQLLALLEHA